jgi:hypothetical protein
VDFFDVKVFGLWDSTGVDQGIGYDSVKRYLVLRSNIGLVDVFAEDSLGGPPGAELFFLKAQETNKKNAPQARRAQRCCT